MGANIGTCLDGIMASLGSNANGKRIAFFHVITSTIGALMFSVILYAFRDSIIPVFENLFPENLPLSLATYNFVYNVIYTLALLPLINPLVRFTIKTVKDKRDAIEQVRYIDDRLLITPAVAIEQSLKEVADMAKMAWENYIRAFDGLIKKSVSQKKLIESEEDRIDYITRALASFFIKISSTHIAARDEKLIGGLHHVINDIERIGDHAAILTKETDYLIQCEEVFIDEVKTELTDILEKIAEIYDMSLDAFITRKIDNFVRMAAMHYAIKDLINSARDRHTVRLNASMYSIEISNSLYSVLFSLERVTAHIVNVGFSIRSDTGSKTEAFELIEKAEKENEHYHWYQ
jgi:phosphate:Na+ symporter